MNSIQNPIALLMMEAFKKITMYPFRCLINNLNKIGDFQLKIMREFPESAILYRSTFTWADIGPEVKLADIESRLGKEPSGQKIWQFKSKRSQLVDVI